MNPEYENTLKLLLNVRSLRAFVRESDYEQLLDAHAKLGSLLEERKAEYEQEKREAEAKEQARLELIKLIAEQGFDPETITIPVGLSNQGKKKSKTTRTPRKPKYQFKDENGETVYWSGNGKKPLVLQKLLDAGHTVEEFLIEQ